MSSTFIVVSDDPAVIREAQRLGQQVGAMVDVYSPVQWEDRVGTQEVKVPSLVRGARIVGHGNSESSDGNGKILPFPRSQAIEEDRSTSCFKVEKINHLEARAIENAIFAFKGNLTEAARALGVGRATLYRKVKQYSIDPSLARKRKAA